MKSIDTLQEIHKTANEIPQMKFLSAESEQKINENIEIVQNLFVVPILTFLFEKNHTKLCEIAKRVSPKTPLFQFIKFAEGLCADETDFEFLTKPENIENYEKLRKFADKFQKEIHGYINILEKVCDNKSLGLYSEFQEVFFFFDEFLNSADNSFAAFFEDYKRVLKLQTQKIFKEFVSINLLEQTLEILDKNKTKISDENILKCYVYGILFFNLHLSNENENLLLKHIEFYIQHLDRKNSIKFENIQIEKYFVQYSDLETRLELCFNAHRFENKKILIPLLKDYSLNDYEVVEFCEKLKKVFDGGDVSFEINANKTKFEMLLFSLFDNNAMVLFLFSFFYAARNGSVNLQKIEYSAEIFSRLQDDGIFVKVYEIAAKYPINDKNELCFHVYGLLYYDLHLSNENECILLQHIKYFVSFLWDSKIPNYNQNNKRKYFIGVDLALRLKWLFEKEIIGDKSKFIPLLKDYSLNDLAIVEFCEKLKKIFYGETVKINFSPSLNVLKNVVFSMSVSGDIIIFLCSLLSLIEREEFVSLKKIEEQKYYSVFEDIARLHFLIEKPADKIKSDLWNLYKYRRTLGEYYETTEFLLANDVFSKILATYNRHKDFSNEEAVSFIVQSFTKVPNKKKLKILITMLYTIVVKDFKLKFDVGDVVRAKTGRVGTVVQVFLGNGHNNFLYSINWGGTTSVSLNDDFELVNKQWYFL